jgi:hypothetical protein
VCFTLDATGRNIIQIYPKDVADLKVAIAQDDMLQVVTMEDENDTTEEDLSDFGQEDEGGLDTGVGVHREGMGSRYNYPIYPVDHEDYDGDDDYGEGDPDSPGETVDNELYVLVESGGVPELVENNSSPAGGAFVLREEWD